jgi:transposase
MQESLFTVAKLEDFVPPDHPLRAIAGLVNKALGGLNELFNEIYADHGRPSRDRLLEQAVVEAFFTEVMSLADAKGLLSKEHFSVDGTLIQAWASHKSFPPKDGSDDQTPPAALGRNAEAKPRSNDTHESTTDPEARLFRKSSNTGAILWIRPTVLAQPFWGTVSSIASAAARSFLPSACVTTAPTTRPDRFSINACP